MLFLLRARLLPVDGSQPKEHDSSYVLILLNQKQARIIPICSFGWFIEGLADDNQRQLSPRANKPLRREVTNCERKKGEAATRAYDLRLGNLLVATRTCNDDETDRAALRLPFPIIKKHALSE